MGKLLYTLTWDIMSSPKTGRMKLASCEEVCQWVDISWREITIDCVKNGFIKSKVDLYESTQEVMEVNTNTESDVEIPDELMDFIESNDIQSDEELKGFDL